jgi:hypothetical protein
MKNTTASLSIMIPTIGRDTLPRVLASLETQDWQRGDEVLLLSDKEHEYAEQCWKRAKLTGAHFACANGPLGEFGYGLLNKYQCECTGSHICHIRDDVIAAPNMLVTIRREIETNADALHIFRMYDFLKQQFFWASKKFFPGNLIGENAVFPNDPKLIGRWGMRHQGDWDFMEHAATLHDTEWHDQITLFHEPPADWDMSQICWWVKERLRHV